VIAEANNDFGRALILEYYDLANRYGYIRAPELADFSG
jgi:hypothetical protein